METTVFKNCKDCKANAKCCAQLGENFQLNGPIVTEKEIKIIDGQIVDHQLWFEIINQIKGRKTYSIKTNNNGQCVFYKNNKCEIYEVRPFDCRIFPLDIFMINSKYYWVCYTKFCEK